MRTLLAPAIGFAAALISAACGGSTLEGSADKLGAAGITSIEFSGSGRWYQFGQAASPKIDYPEFSVSSYTATIDYGTPAARVQMTRLQTVSPSRVRPTPVEQKPDQYVSATTAWNLAVPAGSPAGTAPAPQPQPAAVEERLTEIWSTPHGFLKAALASNASSTPKDDEGVEVSFTPKGLAAYTGWINADNDVQRVRTIIDNPVLGDTPVETTFSNYKDFDGIWFPSKIVRTQGGRPVLDLTVTAVKANAPAAIAVPAEATAPPAPITVTMEKLADGVYYVKGGTHHSVAIVQPTHIVVVEAPQNEARSLAVIAKIKETVPKKPILYIINTHHHFDHSGGLRTYVDEGAIVVTHDYNKEYYETAWKAAHTINPDRLAQSNKPARFESFMRVKHVLDAGGRPIEVHPIERNGHHDAFAMVYLPREGILIEGDAYTPLAAGAPAPAAPNPYSVSLLDNIERLKLNVRQIAALHGPRLTTMADLRAAVGR